MQSDWIGGVNAIDSHLGTIILYRKWGGESMARHGCSTGMARWSTGMARWRAKKKIIIVGGAGGGKPRSRVLFVHIWWISEDLVASELDCHRSYHIKYNAPSPGVLQFPILQPRNPVKYQSRTSFRDLRGPCGDCGAPIIKSGGASLRQDNSLSSVLAAALVFWWTLLRFGRIVIPHAIQIVTFRATELHCQPPYH